MLVRGRTDSSTMIQRWTHFIQRIAVAGAPLLFCLVIAVPGEVWAQWKPARNVELVVPASTGGGIDGTARNITAIFRQHAIIEAPVTVINKPGGGGEIALNYLAQHAGDGHFLTIIAPNLITNSLIQSTRLKHSDFSAIVRLTDQYVVVGVRDKVQTVEDLIDTMKQKPESLSYGIATSLGNFNHMALAMAAKAAGADVKKLKIVVFNSSGDSVTALLGGHVDVVAASAVNLLSHVSAGRLKAIAIASARRLSGPLSGVPTFSERGISSVVGNWRVVVGPKGMPEEQVRFWEQAFEKLVQTPEWKRELERNAWVDAFLRSEATAKFLDKESVELKPLLVELGLSK